MYCTSLLLRKIFFTVGHSLQESYNICVIPAVDSHWVNVSQLLTFVFPSQLLHFILFRKPEMQLKGVQKDIKKCSCTKRVQVFFSFRKRVVHLTWQLLHYCTTAGCKQIVEWAWMVFLNWLTNARVVQDVFFQQKPKGKSFLSVDQCESELYLFYFLWKDCSKYFLWWKQLCIFVCSQCRQNYIYWLCFLNLGFGTSGYTTL